MTAFAALAAVAAGLLTCAGLAACGGGGGGGGSEGKPVTLKVGVLPIGDVAPIYLGAKKGFFKQEKITIKPQVMQGGAEVTAGVVSGDLNLGFSATEPLIVASSKGIPVQIVSQGVQAATSVGEAWDGLMVKGDSQIKAPKDLEGKTVAVNALKSMNELCLRAVLTRKGVDPSKVKFVEVPFPEMTSALDAGRVDAVTAVEPFVSQAKAGGARAVLSYFAGLQPKLTVATYFGKSQYIEQNGDVVTRFARAMKKSLVYAQGHPSEVRKIVPTYTKIPAKVAQKMKLPYWSSDLNRPSIDLVASETKRAGFIKKEPSIDDLIWSGAKGAAGSNAG
jgi:NitT/TauT family transport system substrate-binding protein